MQSYAPKSRCGNNEFLESRLTRGEVKYDDDEDVDDDIRLLTGPFCSG